MGLKTLQQTIEQRAHRKAHEESYRLHKSLRENEAWRMLTQQNPNDDQPTVNSGGVQRRFIQFEHYGLRTALYRAIYPRILEKEIEKADNAIQKLIRQEEQKEKEEKR